MFLGLIEGEIYIFRENRCDEGQVSDSNRFLLFLLVLIFFFFLFFNMSKLPEHLVPVYNLSRMNAAIC